MAAHRLATAARLLVQAPPGQVTQVYHDLRGILLDPEASEDGEPISDPQIQQMAHTALEEYNTQQLIPVTLQEGHDQVLICDAARLPGHPNRYVHPREHKSFAFDHMARTASDIQPLEVDQEAEPIRAALDAAFKVYVADRYSSGVSSVFTVSNVPPTSSSAESVKQEAAKVDSEDPALATAAAGVTPPTTEAEPEASDGKPTESTSTEAAPNPTNVELANDTDNETKDDPVEAAAVADAVSTSPTEATSTTTTTAERDPTSAPSERRIQYVIHHVGNKYHLSNFWSGRFRASYVLSLPPRLSDDSGTASLTSSLQIQVHYFENGNVQLNASAPKTFSLERESRPVPADPNEEAERWAKRVVQVVERYEDEYQARVEETCEELGEKAFKALRRLLPLTKNKIDWGQLMNYRLGRELERA